jgi:DNA-binding MarR family transcriptional regulator
MPLRVKPERQIACLDFLRGYIAAFNQSPTRTEIGNHLGITKVSAHLLVDKLKRDGYVYAERGHHRNLVLTKKGKNKEHWGVSWTPTI